MCLFSETGGEGGAGAAVRSAEGRCQDVPSTKQTNRQTAGGGDQRERQGEEEERGGERGGGGERGRLLKVTIGSFEMSQASSRRSPHNACWLDLRPTRSQLALMSHTRAQR